MDLDNLKLIVLNKMAINTIIPNTFKGDKSIKYQNSTRQVIISAAAST